MNFITLMKADKITEPSRISAHLSDGHRDGGLLLHLVVLGAVRRVESHFVRDAHVGGVALLAPDEDGVWRRLGEL